MYVQPRRFQSSSSSSTETMLATLQSRLLAVCFLLRLLHQGVQCRTLQGHAHWVNTLALSTDYVLRTGAFEPATATVNPQDLTGSRENLPAFPFPSEIPEML